MGERWLTYPEAAARAGVKVRQVQRWRARGLVVGRIDPESRRWMVEEGELMRCARTQWFRRSRFSTHVQPSRQGSRREERMKHD